VRTLSIGSKASAGRASGIYFGLGAEAKAFSMARAASCDGLPPKGTMCPDGGVVGTGNGFMGASRVSRAISQQNLLYHTTNTSEMKKPTF